MTEDISDNMEKCVWEPAVVKKNALQAASEAVCLILSVDETIKNPKSTSGGGAGDMPVPRRPMWTRPYITFFLYLLLILYNTVLKIKLKGSSGIIFITKFIKFTISVH